MSVQDYKSLSKQNILHRGLSDDANSGLIISPSLLPLVFCCPNSVVELGEELIKVDRWLWGE